MSNTTYDIAAVCTGSVQPIGTADGRPVMSAIQKKALPGNSSLFLGPEGLKGDECGDQRVVQGKRIHGGELKAVYAYPRAHYAWWTAQLDEALPPGAFGENLLLDGADEDSVGIGDILVWGAAVLEVTSPRRPCYKLGMVRGLAVPRMMMSSGRCGWYLRVIEWGRVPTSGQIRLLHRPTGSVSVAQAFKQKVASNPDIPGPQD